MSAILSRQMGRDLFCIFWVFVSDVVYEPVGSNGDLSELGNRRTLEILSRLKAGRDDVGFNKPEMRPLRSSAHDGDI